MASFSIVSNIASVNAQANLGATQIGLNKAITRLSSGFRINFSGDDAAGLAVANKYRSNVAILNQGVRTPTTVCRSSRSRTAPSTTSQP